MTFSLAQRVGTVLMITLALAIQPTQYALAAEGMKSASSGFVLLKDDTDNCDAPPEDPDPALWDGCHRISPNPPSPSGGSAPEVNYFLLPGIGDGTQKFDGQSGYFDGSRLPEFLANTNQSDVRVNVTQRWADWKTKDLTVQGRDLANDITQIASNNAKVVLIGHSMGGLRGRSAVQFNNNAFPLLTTNVKALVTLGTPHRGAPIINNGKPAATLVGGVMGAAASGFVGLGPHTLLTGVAGMFGLRTWAKSIIDTPSGQDMRPGSGFLTRLNYPSASEQVPANVALLRISGLNNDIDALGASGNVAETTDDVRTLRTGVSNFLFVSGTFAVAMAFFTWGATLPWGLALLGASYLLATLPAFWRNNVVGSSQGDTVVPRDSQSIPDGIGGSRPVSDLDLQTAVHTGRYGEYQAQSTNGYTENVALQERLKALQTRLDLPTSL